MSEKVIKSRNWSAVVYPESLPKNWLDILQDLRIPIAVSPLHDKDVNPDGEIKKAHYHLIICFDGPTTLNNVIECVTKPLNAPNPVKCLSVRGSWRYFMHLDNPDKAAYSGQDIKYLGGFDIQDYLSSSEITKCILKIHEIIIENKIIEYWDLMEYLRINQYFDYYQIASNHTLYFNSLLKSRNYKVKKIINK